VDNWPKTVDNCALPVDKLSDLPESIHNFAILQADYVEKSWFFCGKARLGCGKNSKKGVYQIIPHDRSNKAKMWITGLKLWINTL
jgi:hypothetical protein